MQESKRCFVTGATGFIGSHLVRHLIERGFHVRCLVRSEYAAQRLSELPVESRIANLLEPDEMKSAVAGCNYVFHLAGITKGISAKEFLHVNATGISTVAKACADQATSPTLVYVSSLAAVGPARNGTPVSEETSQRPVSAYGRSKLAGEQSLRNFAHIFPATIVRPPIVLGERDPNGLELFRGVARMGIHCVPTFRRHHVSIVHVDDLVTALLESAIRGERLNESDATQGVYHVEAEIRPSYADLGRMIARAIGRERVFVLPVATPVLKLAAGINELRSWITKKPEVLNWDKSREAAVGPWVCSAEKIRRQLGFDVAKPLQERLNQTAQWYSDQGYFRLVEISRGRSHLRTDT